ncbi:Nramp family divalent metal transporter [Mycobacterium sp. NPDC003449]
MNTAKSDRPPITTTVASTQPPRTFGQRVRLLGPGLLIAATGIGAGDMVTAVVAGADYGYALLWAIIIGVAIKYPLSEAIGRYFLAGGETMLQGWRRLSRWASRYFVFYLFCATFFTSAGLCSVAALAVDAMFPGVLPIWAWAVVHAVAAFAIVWVGRFAIFERLMEVLVGLMFVMAVTLAVLLVPDLGELSLGALPTLPDASLLNVLAIIGGIGGVYSLCYYPYWARAKGWNAPSWIPWMRTDLAVGYLVEAIFMVAMLVIGVELLFGTGADLQGNTGLLALSNPIADRFGAFAGWLFLIGFWAAVTSSILGNWNGASHMFADYMHTRRSGEPVSGDPQKSRSFRAFLVWITFPPMVLLGLSQPFLLVMVYTSLGALFFPFLAATLLWLLNKAVGSSPNRNRWLSNTLLVLCALFFVWAGIQSLL